MTPFPFIWVFWVLVVILYILLSTQGPLYFLTLRRTVSQQVKRFFHGEGDGIGLVTIRLTTKRYPCSIVIYTIRKCSTITVLVRYVFVIPLYKSFAESYWTSAFLVNTILAWKNNSYLIFRILFYHKTGQITIRYVSFMFIILFSILLSYTKTV